MEKRAIYTIIKFFFIKISVQEIDIFTCIMYDNIT